MPPKLATLIYCGFVIWLFRRDFREKPNVSRALWIPFWWMFISGTRFVSQWLEVFHINLGGSSVEEGSPVDAIFFFGLIGAGIYVLQQRRVSLSEFMRYNQWVTIYLVYCLLANFWSDYPLVAFKRWIKLFGQPIMVLIILTEPDPMEALIRMMKWCAYIEVPISVLFIKYFPELGREFSSWTGQADNHGICLGKNGLGFDCFILGFFFFWYFLQVLKWDKGKAKRNEIILCVGFLGVIWWLFTMAPSSTSMICLTVAIALVAFLGLRFVNARNVGIYLVAFVAIYGTLEGLFDIQKVVISALGKDPSLTGRTEIWQYLLKSDINPVLGAGFESYWLGDEAKKLNAMYEGGGVVVNEAHNGYIETYLNLGGLGLVMTLGLVLATYSRARQTLIYNFNLGRFRIAYLVAILIYNWTEAAFRTHSVPFFLFFLCAIDYPTGRQPAMAASEVVIQNEPDENLVECPQSGRSGDNSLVENARSS